MRNDHASMVRKRFYTCAVIGNFFCLLATASASEPTLQESIDFIQTKVKGHSCEYVNVENRPNEKVVDLHKSSGTTIALLDNKTILVEMRRARTTVLEHYSTSSDSYYSERKTVVQKVRMADLSTNVKIRIHDGTERNIEVNCRKSGCLEWKETDIKKTTPYLSERSLSDTQGVSSSSILFTVCDQERAEKIKKALTHVIRISGGKDELF